MDIEISREKQEFWRSILYYQQVDLPFDTPKGIVRFEKDIEPLGLLKEETIASQLARTRLVHLKSCPSDFNSISYLVFYVGHRHGAE